jgi:hypothetical protein
MRLACQFFAVSETRYRYEAKKSAENERIADWLLRPTDNDRNWGAQSSLPVSAQYQSESLLKHETLSSLKF